MRYLLIILSLLSFSFSQLLPSDEDIAQMSSFEKQTLYEDNKKSPMTAIAWELFVPTAGHAYIDDWGRGVSFVAGEVFLIGMGIYMAEENPLDITSRSASNIGQSIMASAIILRLYQYVDVYKQTKNYNDCVYEY